MKHVLIGSIVLGAALLAFPFSSGTAQAKVKKLPTVTTYSPSYNKVKFNYTSRSTKSFSVTKAFPDNNDNVKMKLTKLAYYKLKPKHNKRILVRAYFHITTTKADQLGIFSYDFYNKPYLNTSNGNRLYQSGMKELYGSIQMNGKDVANTHVDFLSSKVIPFANFNSGEIHFNFEFDTDLNEFPFS
ncbi:hypothetical protein [Lentilactobacillus kefiri]|nr:hypothetical protein [Lentilactobacillus kefiri]MCJ2162422.1 hypothetical protein [Lentilactobacillus kefiri]MCP9370171.1 hypothetical protein [Lentilactobacillus kefiri]PAK81920.1 hypothetical protein B8W85_09105 [Lentilactobacillus kefiri]PAL05667.1 hypothetical protein B8W93_08965 [Lentilactobacillus kefiri]QGV24722.1 hypothetical protein DNL43_05365 [Lentilactobacillus kefiri]